MTNNDMQTVVPVTVLQERLNNVAQEIRNLTMEKRLIESLIGQAVPIHQQETTPSENGTHYTLKAEPSVFRAMGMDAEIGASGPPRIAIVELIRKQPGLTPTEIAERLEATVQSRAKDKRNVIRTTVANMVRGGQLRRDDGHHHYLAE